ncbi:MAG: hypothetical protein MUF71_20520 [Candidatus Kapabacteria bacterium]|jgi:hypothetical protein|nr:hypothetical protein [Candidatus Kapabacteria bacterium]
MKSSSLRTFAFALPLVAAFLTVSLAGLHIYLHSNLSTSQKISLEAGAMNENLESVVTKINAQQSAITQAASMVQLDPRAFGAAIAARRVLHTQPVLTEVRELAGLTENVGLSQICVSSTEAAFRVVFTPSREDSILYYPHKTSCYDEARSALGSYKHLRGEALKTALRQNTHLNVLAAALLTKQALVRFEKENSPARMTNKAALTGALYHDAADFPFPTDIPITTTADASNFGALVALLYSRSDLLP